MASVCAKAVMMLQDSVMKAFLIQDLPGLLSTAQHQLLALAAGREEAHTFHLVSTEPTDKAAEKQM